MAILKNKTQGNFTMISNLIARDKELSLKERGLYLTLASLPDGWNFSIGGIAAIVADGYDSVYSAFKSLRKKGLVTSNYGRDEKGRFHDEIELHSFRKINGIHGGKTILDKPKRGAPKGSPKLERQAQYNKNNKKEIYNSDVINSINHSHKEASKEEMYERYQEIVAKNIDLSRLVGEATARGPEVVKMVREIFDIICDMVTFERDTITIKGTNYPWQVVKSRFLHLEYMHIQNVVNKIINNDSKIIDMRAYLISTLYVESMINETAAQASNSEKYAKRLREEFDNYGGYYGSI